MREKMWDLRIGECEECMDMKMFECEDVWMKETGEMGGGLYSFDFNAMREKNSTNLDENKRVNPFSHGSILEIRAEKGHMRILLKSEDVITSSFGLSLVGRIVVRDDQHQIYFYLFLAGV